LIDSPENMLDDHAVCMLIARHSFKHLILQFIFVIEDVLDDNCGFACLYHIP